MERGRVSGGGGCRATMLRGVMLLAAMLMTLCAGTAPAGGAGGAVPKKEGVYLVEGAKNLPLQEAGSIWKIQGDGPIIVLPTVRAGSDRPVFVLVGKFEPRQLRLAKLKSSVYDMGKPIGLKFNALGWVEEKEIELGAAAGAKRGVVRLTPAARLEAGIYSLVDNGTGRRYPFGVGDLEKVFADAAIDPRTYIRVAARDQKRFDMLGHNLKEKFTGRFLFVKDDDIVTHPMNPELKFSLNGFKEADYHGTPVSMVTINVVKNMALVEVHALMAAGSSFPANIDGCYFELVSRSRLPDNRSQYGLLIHCPK